MSILIDILLVLSFAGCIALFAKYGFARTTEKVGNAWLSVFLSMILGPLISGRIEAWFMSDMITNAICNTLNNILENSPTGYHIEALYANLPEGFIILLDHYKISLAELKAEYGNFEVLNMDMLMSISYKIAAPLAALVSSLIGHIIGGVVPYLELKWIYKKQCDPNAAMIYYKIDKALGGLVGLGIGSAIVIGACFLLHTTFQVIVAFNAGSNVLSIYENSIIFKFFGKFDIIGIFKSLFGN